MTPKNVKKRKKKVAQTHFHIYLIIGFITKWNWTWVENGRFWNQMGINLYL
jgi:hypothetical protein